MRKPDGAIRHRLECMLGPRSAGLLRYQDGMLAALLVGFKSLDCLAHNLETPEHSHVLPLQ